MSMRVDRAAAIVLLRVILGKIPATAAIVNAMHASVYPPIRGSKR
ncbi:hypothetical protein [Roseateles oligotrophus]|nr:hypothetical protein [Roseateles oligotrophus]